MHDITKICADRLRAFTNENYGIKLRAAHAHELVAACFGYQSRAALLADTQYPLGNLRRAKVIVLSPTAPIDQRRQSLQELSPDLPDTYALAEEVYSALITEQWLLSQPWPTYEYLAISLADQYLRQQGMEKVYRAPVREDVKVEREPNSVCMVVSRFYQIPRTEGGVHEANVTTGIRLPRLAAHIGYADPEISVKIEDLGVRR